MNSKQDAQPHGDDMTAHHELPSDAGPASATPYVWFKRLLKLGIAVIGFKYGFDFGAEVSGVLLGLAVGLNAAVFCYFMAASFPSLLPGKRRARPTLPAESTRHATDPGEEKTPRS